MSWAMFRVMALDLWRDRPALAMTFLLPSVVFLIFSAVFAGATGIDVKLKLALADLVHTPAAERLAHAVAASPDLRVERALPESLAVARRLVREGRADAGLVIRADPAAPGPPPLLILSDPSRAVAAPLAEARVEALLQKAEPDVLLTRTLRDLGPAIGPLTPDQRQNVAVATEEAARNPSAAPADELFALADVVAARRGGANIAYYAGGVMILFALFAATHGALTLIDERRSGVADRILAGRAGMAPVVTGKLMFLVIQGLAQATVVFATAQLVYAVPVLQHLGLWLATTLAAALASAGLALGLVSLCRTREQAQMLATFVVLILAAIGGSMIPRFLMPPWLQTLGWWTPHAWVIEAYQSLLWRDEGPQSLYMAWIVLALIGAVGFGVAQAASRRVRV
jgi:ABC-2 type transport system permease protein